MIKYIIPFIVSLALSLLFVCIIKKIALKYQIVDNPEVDPNRKIHKKPMPLLGGLAIFLSFNITVIISLQWLLGGYMLTKYLWGIFVGGLLLMVVGFLDDKYNLKPSKQVIFPLLASLVVIASGIGITYITNPFGGIIYFQQFDINLFSYNNLPYKLTLLADFFTIIWLMGMMYTTKILDGLDGLVSGITAIGAFIIFCLSLTSEVSQPETAILAIILVGACLGFLVFNFNPAKIYLGEGGSLLTGFLLGVLAIISGAKIATALLIMGIPILDLAWVIIRRFIKEKKSPFRTADKKHLHFKLLDIGFSHRQAVLFLYFLTAAFGTSSLFLHGLGKLIALIIMSVITFMLFGIVLLKYKNNKMA